MAKRRGLPKKYAKMGFKKGWAAYKRVSRTPARRTRTTPISRTRSRPMAKRKNYRRKARSMTSMFTSKTAMDGYIAEGGKFLVRKILGGGPIYEAGVDGAVGIIRNNNTLVAQAVVKGITAFLPSLNLGGGTTGGVR